MLNPNVMATQINIATSTLLGPTKIKLSKGISKSICTWAKLQSNVLVIGSTNGAAGAGQVQGKMFFVPNTVAMNVAFTSVGLNGPTARLLANGLAVGITTALNTTAQYRGSSTGAIGADVSKVVFANPATLIPLLKANLGSQQINGLSSNLLCTAISNGVVGIMLTGTGTGISVGGAGPAPSTGISRSKLY